MKVLLYRPRITDGNCEDLHKRKKTEMVTGETVRSCFLENVSVNLRLNSSHTSQNMSKFYLQIKRLPVRVTVSNVSGALALHLILLEYCVASDLSIILQISLRGHWIPEFLSDCFEHASPILGPSDARIITAGDISDPLTNFILGVSELRELWLWDSLLWLKLRLLYFKVNCRGYLGNTGRFATVVDYNI